MKWPWVSRRAYDIVLEELQRLRGQNDKLFEHLGRMDRVEHGLGEMPREARPQLLPPPPEVRQYIEGFATPSLRKQMWDQCLRRHAKGEHWDSIRKDIQDQERADREGEHVPA